MASLRDRILDAAEHLVLERGFAATTVDAVLASAGASKGAFFHHFPSKTHLGRALVGRYAVRDSALLEAHMSAAEAESTDPARQLIQFVRSLEQGSDAAMEQQPSCLLVSFIYENQLDDHEVAAHVRASIGLWRRRISDKLQEAARVRPELGRLDLEALADHVFTTIEGAFLLARAMDDPTAMRRQLGHVRHYLELTFGLPVSSD